MGSLFNSSACCEERWGARRGESLKRREAGWELRKKAKLVEVPGGDLKCERISAGLFFLPPTEAPCVTSVTALEDLALLLWVAPQCLGVGFGGCSRRRNGPKLIHKISLLLVEAVYLSTHSFSSH